jgi:class 3 adenylate cyclase
MFGAGAVQYVRFCPASVLRRLHYAWADLGEAGPKPDVQQFWTTLFFADISGFTRLSARLNAEQLKTHTNNYFTMLMDVVARYGGDIIKFCGDAVMVSFASNVVSDVMLILSRASLKLQKFLFATHRYSGPVNTMQQSPLKRQMPCKRVSVLWSCFENVGCMM